MSIGTTIRKLRRDRNITQEQLAELLGVSTNAVSQWECNKTAPDLSLLPILANIFEVSADILLEIDIARNKKQSEIKDFTVKCAELHSKGSLEERLLLCRTMQKKYPNDETVRYHLMRVLQNGYIDENFDEIISLGEQLLTSSKMEYRTGAIRGLCLTYLHIGNKSKALQYADMIPFTEDVRVHVLEGNARIEHCQNYFWKVCDQMYLYMSCLLDCQESKYSHEEKHSLWTTLYDMFHLIFPNRDFGVWNERLAKVSFFMAMESAKCEEFERTIKELGQMLVHIENNNGSEEFSHSSPLVNRITASQSSLTKHSAETLAHSSLRYLNNKESAGTLTPIKDDIRYIKIKDRLASLT